LVKNCSPFQIPFSIFDKKVLTFWRRAEPRLERTAPRLGPPRLRLNSGHASASRVVRGRSGSILYFLDYVLVIVALLPSFVFVS
jgi:hypothetical protein